MYKCIIIDDEPIAIRVIRKHLSVFSGFEIIAECSNALEAMPILSANKTDLIFCDIEMPQITGVDFIKSLTNPPKVIFTTAYRNYAIDAFELQVIDYLLKPVSFERFAKAINNFLEHISVSLNNKNQTVNEKDTTEFIFLKADKKHHKVNLRDILYFESMGDYVIAIINDKKIVTKERIGNLANQLSEKFFIQIHRSYIVSISKIEAVGSGFVEVNNKKLPVGRNYKPQLNRLLQKS
jgi:DNA-binding LytR/AlgR family response regulator